MIFYIHLDNSCGYRAIYVGLRYHELDIKNKGTKHKDVCNEWRKVIGNNYSLSYQTEGTQEFCAAAGLDMSKPLDGTMFKKIQEYLEPLGYQLVIIDSFDTSNRIYVGLNLDKPIFLEFIDTKNAIDGTPNGHFNFIKEMNAYLKNRYYCKYCNKGFNVLGHRCKECCKMCQSMPPCEKLVIVDCDGCNRSFLNITCYNNHRENDTCKYLKKCEKCWKDYKYIS